MGLIDRLAIRFGGGCYFEGGVKNYREVEERSICFISQSTFISCGGLPEHFARVPLLCEHVGNFLGT